MDLIIKPTERCNFKCTFCSSTAIADSAASLLDLDRVYLFLKRFPETRTIIVNGGDPLMVDPEYYWALIEHLDQYNYPATISFTSNLWPFYINPDKWIDLFKHPRMGVATSFQFGSQRLKGDLSVFTLNDFWAVSDKMLELVGYRPSFIAVITEENEDTVLDTVRLAKEMNVVCKVNYAMASGIQSKPFMMAKLYQHYVNIWKEGLHPWEHNTQQMMVRLQGRGTTCPQTRSCDSGIRTLQPDGDYYSCGAFGDDREYAIDFDKEMAGDFFTPLESSIELMSMKQSCFTCPLFQICNGCKKTISDQKKHNMVEEHCQIMKELAQDIITANGLQDIEITPYVNEEVDTNKRIIWIKS